MIAASGTPRFRSNSGHTLAGTRAMTIPETMARSEMGNFAQRLDTSSCVVICGVLGTVADEPTLPTSTTNSLSSSVCDSGIYLSTSQELALQVLSLNDPKTIQQIGVTQFCVTPTLCDE